MTYANAYSNTYDFDAAGTLSRVEAWHAMSGQLVRRNRVPKRVGTRAGGGGPGFTAPEDPTVWNTLFPEDSRRPHIVSQSIAPYSPVGLLSGTNWAAELDEYNAPSTTTVTFASGTNIANKIIYGDVFPADRVGDVTFSNCWFRGGSHNPTGNTGIVALDSTANSGSSSRWRFWDCEFSAQNPAPYRDGIRGNRWEAYRCVVRDTIDGYAPYSAGVNSGNAYVKMMGCIAERLVYMYPDAEHSDGTHNDCVQVHGGKAVEIWGCFLNGTSYRLAGSGTNPAKPWATPPLFTEDDTALGWAHGSGLIVIDDTGISPDNTVYVHHNWLRGALATSTIHPNLTCRFENNRTFVEGTGAHTNPTWGGTYYQRLVRRTTTPNYAQVTGLNPAGDTTVVNIGNVWANGPNAGQLLNQPRANGIDFVP